MIRCPRRLVARKSMFGVSVPSTFIPVAVLLLVAVIGVAVIFGLRRDAARAERRHRSQNLALAGLASHVHSLSRAQIEKTMDDHLFDPPPARRLPAFPAQRTPDPTPDLNEGRRLRDEGIELSTANAPKAWKDAAWAALLRVIARGGEFTTDALWEELDAAGVPRPKQPKAISGVMLRGARAGLIGKTDRTEPTAQRQANARDKAIWRVK